MSSLGIVLWLINVLTMKVICHHVTGRSKGYGFVKFSWEGEAAAPVKKMSDEVNKMRFMDSVGTAEDAEFLQDNTMFSAQLFSLC